MSDEHTPENPQPTHPDEPTEAATSPEAEAPEPEEAPAAGRTPGWAKAALGVLTVLALTAGAGGYFLGSTMANSTSESEAAYIGGPRGPLHSLADIHRVNPADPFALGAQDATVVISYFSDFACPACAAYAKETEPKIIEEYVNKGRVRIEWNDFPFLGESSILAAQGGRAAAAQGKFWEYKEALYGKFTGNEHPTYGVDDLVGFAEQAGVPDLDRFRTDLESNKYAGTIIQALTYGTALGINSTPSFVINGVPVLDNDYDSLKKAIEQSLDKGQPDPPTLPENNPGEGTSPGQEANPAPVEG
ncbi:thioredoxin domain-containing protein [Corynebacterium sp. zg-331]|uniref:DsbA family protein n=1 Tax=unclassified Corynebacterium TaxID=2624378 RepID=UPI0016435D39|nr:MULTISPECIES: thioredoxin domain-containing protein [unclassified Corynebacterium]MBC3186676.1 thioredoxin domain-containing protein [Corynebacterium sp. zg-331]